VIRFAARQFRTQAVVAAIGLAVVGVTVLVTGPHLAHLYDTTVAGCGSGQSCFLAADAFGRKDRLLQGILGMLILTIPALIGIFWGAPLVARELETSTFRLAWTQSVTRTRWLVVKVVLVALAAVAVAGLVSLMATWWFSPLDRVNANRFDPSQFTQRGLVPAAYAAFAVALGTAVGLVVRRTVAAMAITLVVFIGVLLVMTTWVRPHLLPPVTVNQSVTSASGFGFTPNASGSGVDFMVEPPSVPNAWVLSSRVVDSGGQGITAQFMRSACPQIKPPPPDTRITRAPADKNAFLDCVRTIAQTYHVEMTYQPAGRYWVFQSMESGVFVLLALGLGAFSVWWVRRRVA
jgi:ABC-2 family transporter protein